jgi:multisubunit Na+/H+ antiporter MnhB subunit
MEFSIISFLQYLLQRYMVNILPVFAMLAVTVLALVLAIRKKEFRFSLRLWSVISILLLFAAVALQSLQPIVQVYLEEELQIIFLEANKYTSAMRNYRYFLYPLAMFILGMVIFDERRDACAEAEGGDDEQ